MVIPTGLLHLAAYAGNPTVVQMLIDSGVSVNATMENQSTALHVAAEKGDPTVVQMLIEKGASVNATCENQWTALHTAAYKGHPTVVQTLIEKGALVNATCEHQWTVLHLAAQTGDPRVVQVLIENGASVNITEENQSTALHLATYNGHPAVAQMLIENGASVNATDKNQRTALHMAAQIGDPTLVQMLIASGASVNTTNENQWTALHVAVEKGNRTVLQMLIENGALVNAPGKDWSTALHMAAQTGDPIVVQMLIESGASVNATNENHWTALHKAAQKKDPAAFDLLMLHGADLFASSAVGQIPLHLSYQDTCLAALHHMCGFCMCKEQHAVDPSKVNSTDCWGRSSFQLSLSIRPFVLFYERYTDIPLPCVYAIDREGSAEIHCAHSSQWIHVLKLHWDLADVQAEQTGDKLSRKQTHVLRYMLREYLDNDLPSIFDKWEDFVFGSVLQGDAQAICSFPCNFAHNSKEKREMDELLSMKDDMDQFCHHLMGSFLQKCDMESRQSKSVTSDIELFLDELSVFFKNHCWLLQFQWKMVGSSVEGTKIGFPDEYDALLYFTELSRYVKVQDGDIKWCGMDAVVEKEMAQWSPHKIIAVGVKIKIFQLINDFLAENQSWNNLSYLCLRSFKRGYSTIFHVSNTDVVIDAKVDLVPLVGDGQRWYVFKDVCSNTQRDILPSEHHTSDFEPESFALRELELMRSLLPNAREGYVMAKSLRDAHFLSHMMKKPILSDLVDRVFPSHALKHALFHAFAEEGIYSLYCILVQKIPKKALKPHEWAQRIFVQMKNEHLRDFFTDKELFSEGNHPYPRQLYLNRFIRRRRPGHQTFPLLMKEKEYRKLFIKEILKILN